MADAVSPAGGTSDVYLGAGKSIELVLASRLTWLMLFRSVVVTTVLLGAVAQRAGNEDALFANDAVELYIACGLSFVVVLLGALWLRYRGARGILPLTHLQLLWDALFATVLCHATGGLTSALSFLYFLTVLAAAALLSRRQVLLVTLECVTLYSVLLLAELIGFGNPLPGKATLAEVGPAYLTNVVGLSLVAVLAGYLTDQLRSASENLRSAKANLILLEELHAAVLSSLPSGVLTVDSDRRVLYVNEAGAAILGQPPGALVGRSPTELVAEPLQELLRVTSARAGRFELELSTGTQGRVIGGSIASLHGVQGLAGEVLIFQDLTELRRLQRELDRSLRFASMGRMSARLAHEIRNPLAAMIGCLDLMEQDAQAATPAPPVETLRMLGIVSREARRLSNLVTAFLGYARPPQPQVEPHDLRPLVEQALAALAPSTEVNLDLRAEKSAFAYIDPEQFQQVIWNLLMNATAAAREHPRPESPPAVRVTLRTEGAHALLVVEDTGPGVPPELREHIFEPFFTTRDDGTGLGLAVSEQLVQACGGTIEVNHSSDLQGAAFVIRLRAGLEL